MSDWPDTDICQKFEDVAWEHRKEAEIPKTYDGKSEAMGYTVIENWEPDPAKTTVDLTCFPHWIDKEAFEKRLPELWQWRDAQLEKMRKIVLDLLLEFSSYGCPAEFVQVPRDWMCWLNVRHIAGVKVIKGTKDDEVRMFSPDHYGRFAVSINEKRRAEHEERRRRLEELKNR